MKLSAVIIKGNTSPQAASYYYEVEKYLHQLGVNEIIYSDCASLVAPPKGADLYINHSHPVDRDMSTKESRIPFVELGLPSVDEHFLFNKEQREAVRHAVESACKRTPAQVVTQVRR